MFDAIFGRVTELFGRSFLIAGLLPAIYLIAGTAWIVWPQNLDAANLPALWAKTPTEEIIKSLTAVLIAALLLFSLRRLILDIVAHHHLPLPARWIEHFSYWARKKRALAQRKSSQAREELTQKATAVEWAIPDPGYRVEPFWKPGPLAGYQAPARDALQSSEHARAALEQLLPGDDPQLPTNKQTGIIRDGLWQLFRYALTIGGDDEDTAYNTELENWRQLVRNNEAKDILLYIKDNVQREWARFDRKVRLTPADRWLHTTIIGNEFGLMDAYSEMRYGINTETLWDRLWWILGEQEKTDVAAARTSVNAAGNFLFVSALLLVVATVSMVGALYARSSANIGVAIFKMLVFFALILSFYFLAVYTIRMLRSKVVTIIDVKVGVYLEHLGYEARAFGDERKVLEELNQFYNQGFSRDLPRKLADDKSPSPEDVVAKGEIEVFSLKKRWQKHVDDE